MLLFVVNLWRRYKIIERCVYIEEACIIAMFNKNGWSLQVTRNVFVECSMEAIYYVVRCAAITGATHALSGNSLDGLS